MNKVQIWAVLECCLLASDGSTFGYLINAGFKPEIAKAGLQLCEFLKTKELMQESTA